MSTPLYDKLVSGMFNDMYWRDFVNICEEIIEKEGKSAQDMQEAISRYLIANEPAGGYALPHKKVSAHMPDGEVALLRTLRKALKNIPLDAQEEEIWKHFEQHQQSATK